MLSLSVKSVEMQQWCSHTNDNTNQCVSEWNSMPQCSILNSLCIYFSDLLFSFHQFISSVRFFFFLFSCVHLCVFAHFASSNGSFWIRSLVTIAVFLTLYHSMNDIATMCTVHIIVLLYSTQVSVVVLLWRAHNDCQKS